MRREVSLIFTDIVGSTRLWAEHEDVMAGALARHDELVADAINSVGGAVFKHTGDGMAAVFGDARQAIQAASRVQLAIGDEAWDAPGGVRVRVAIHSGAVHERDGDMFGPTVNRSARLLGCCPGGAVMVSEVTAGLLGDELPDGLSLDPIGRVQLRDLAQSELVFALCAEHLAVVDPWTIDEFVSQRPPGWLPPDDSSLVGRDELLQSVITEVMAQDLVTVVGLGGMGKTRVALAAAHAVVEAFADGVWWCDLAAATSGAAVPAVVLSSIAARQLQGSSQLQSVADHLAARHALLILDNCEHVTHAVRELVEAIRRTAPAVTILAISAEPLSLRNEAVVGVSSMATHEAERLFVSRATGVRPDLVWDKRNLVAVREICEQLDGIPLAVELAAARCRSLSPVEIATRLDDRFRLLRGGQATIERHRTLEAAVSWSYAQLDDAERRVFEHLSVFPSGAMLDAIASVAGLDEFEALDLLDGLAVRSMVLVVDTPIGTRYRQLETLRQFAEARLAESRTLESVRDAHLEWAENLACWIGDSLLTVDEPASFRRYVAEIDNFRAAVEHAGSAGRWSQAMRLMSGVMLWAICRPSYEILEWIDDATLLQHGDDPVGVTVAAQIAELALFAGETQRAELLGAALAAHERSNAAVARALAQQMLWVHGDVDRAEEMLSSAVVTQEIDEFLRRFYVMNVANARATMSTDVTGSLLPDPSDGLSLVEERRSGGGRISLAASLAILSFLHVDRAEFSDAMSCASEAEAIARELGALFIVDLANVGRASSLSQVHVTSTEGRSDAVLQLRDFLVEAVAHRNHFLVGNLLGDDVAATLWAIGDTNTAILIRDVAARHYPIQRDPLPSNAGELAGSQAIAEITRQATTLSLITAAEIAAAALEKAVRGVD